jgi:hypothetical protein
MSSKVTAVQNYRCGRNMILGKHSGDRSGDLGYAEGKVEQFGFLDSAMDTGGLKSQRCSDPHRFSFHLFSMSVD